MCPDQVIGSKPVLGESQLPQDPADQVAVAGRVLSLAGNADMIWGHIAVRDPVGRGLWMKAAGWGFDEVVRERVLLVGFDGTLLAGDGPVHIEYPIHSEILRARPEIGAVVHTHAPSVVSFAALDVPMRAMSHEACLFCPPDIPRFRETSGLISTDVLGRRLAKVLADRPAALLPGHGLVAVGTDAALAVMTAIFLDRACSTQLAAEAGGGPRIWADGAEAAEKRQTAASAAQLRAAWRYLMRRCLPGRGG